MNLSRFNKSSNPMMRNKSFAKVETLESRTGGPFIANENQMTVTGAVNKTFVLAVITIATFMVGYAMPSTLFYYGGLFSGIALYFYTTFKPHHAPITAPLFAAAEGLLIGTVSFMYAQQFQGIVLQAGSLTIGTLLSMLMLYKTGTIKVTKSLRTGVSMAVGAVMLVYMVQLIGNVIGFSIPFLFTGGPISIVFSLAVIGLASFNLLLDFDNFEQGERMGAPKYMEWYFGMGLLFTIVWLYVEFLRLLSYLNRD